MKIALGILAAVLTVVLVASIAQTHRYLQKRRDIVGDRQELFHSSSVFHVVTLVELAPDQELLEGMRGLVRVVEEQGGEPIYAGKIAVNALASRQLPEAEWDAFLLAQYPSRAAYEAAADGELAKVRAGFHQTYALGLQRPAIVNVGIPIALLGMRVMDVLQGQPPRYPFEPAQIPANVPAETLAQRDRMVGGLLANREYGRDALVVLNFLKDGSAEERAANQGYGNAMLGMMAELGIGPMHMGAAVTLEGDADFDNVAIVYYPGVEFFAEMVQSRFFAGISGGKQLGDTLAAPSVPILPHL